MLRRTCRRNIGYTPVNPDTSPMLQYNNYHWHYNFSQNMEAPSNVNRRMAAPFSSVQVNVNKFRGVWVDFNMAPAFRIALAPQLDKLPLGRKIPNTDPSEAIADFEAVSPLVGDVGVKDAWLAKVIQLCGFHKKADGAVALFAKHCEARLAAGETPHLPLIIAMLFCLSSSNHANWKPLFERCLKSGWNVTPHFPTKLWDTLLMGAGQSGDQQGVRLLLEEMLDVQADLDRLKATCVVMALNAIESKADYEYVKKYLFNFGEKKTLALAKVYSSMRTSEGDAAIKDNDKMYYHVMWHSSIRQPRQFSPRQLYFDYQPSALTKSTHHPNTKIETVVKDKIEQWKKEGLLPEDYEHTDKVYDRQAAYKSIIRHEKWKKHPAFLKDPKFGYHGDP